MTFRSSRPQPILREGKANSLNRAQFLRGNWRGVADMMPPPWAIEGDAFFKLCTQCNDCISTCPESILVKTQKGYPQVDFNRGECTFCGDCETACKPNALLDTKQAPWHYHAQINSQCLSQKGVVCRTCGDCCDEQAIHFRLAIGGFSTPELDIEQCTGCGACVAPCPTNSIEMTRKHPAQSTTN